LGCGATAMAKSRNHIARLLRMATVEAAQDVMADFILRKADSSTREGRATNGGIAMIRVHPIWTLADDNGFPRRAT
jgi:hypothetical protein